MPAEQPHTRFMPGFGAGHLPGEAIYAGVERDFDVRIDVFDWTDGRFEEIHDATVDQAVAVRGRPTVSWVNVSGIHDAALVERIGERFGLHALSIEDILHPRHRPKVEHYPEYLYFVLQMAYARPDGTTHLEQLSLVLGDDFVLTFQERAQDVFGRVRHQLRDPKGLIRQRGADYLAYALMDAVVDSYVEIIEAVGRRVEAAEDDLEEGADPDRTRALPSTLHQEKRELMALRKVVVPLREAVASVGRDETERIQARNRPYLRDLHDHLVQLVDAIDVYREMIASLLGLHLSLLGQRTNEEMKVLTVIATIFIPLTFLAGVYGMNFDYMPELHLRWAYPLLWVVMIAVAGGLLSYFRRRRWF